eukprot:jgi/Mesvir1/523/Mv25272-RA.1
MDLSTIPTTIIFEDLRQLLKLVIDALFNNVGYFEWPSSASYRFSLRLLYLVDFVPGHGDSVALALCCFCEIRRQDLTLSASLHLIGPYGLGLSCLCMHDDLYPVCGCRGEQLTWSCVHAFRFTLFEKAPELVYCKIICRLQALVDRETGKLCASPRRLPPYNTPKDNKQTNKQKRVGGWGKLIKHAPPCLPQ